MQIINNSIKAFKAEWIKLRGIGIWLMIAITCGFVVVSSLLIRIYSDEVTKPSSVNPWEIQISRSMGGFMFMYILLSILIIVRICQTEHRNQGWKLIETQPIHRAYLYIAKYKMALVLSLISLLFFFLLSVISTYGFSFYKNELAYRENSIPWLLALSFLLRIWIASWGFMAFQYMISIWINNFAFPFMIGFVLTVTAMPLQFSGTATWFPYAAPIFAAGNFNGGVTSTWLLHHEQLSIVWMLIFLWIGYEYYYYRNWKLTLGSGKQALKFIAAVALFALAFYFIEKPVTNGRYHKTIISGNIRSAEKLKGVLVFTNPALMDTLLTIPLNQGSFHAEYNGKPLSPGYYALSIGNQRVMIFMSADDSVNIDWNLGGTGMPPEIRGTRIAENSMRNKYTYQDYMGTMKNKPSIFTGALMEQWENDMESIEGFKTVDNIRPSEDFIDMQKKLATVSYLQALKIDYPRMHAMYYPGDTLKYSNDVDRVLNTLGMNDTSLLMNEEYVDLLDKELRYSKNFREYDYDSAYLDAVVNSDRNVKVKNAMLFDAMKNMITSSGDSMKRNGLFNKYIGYEKDALYTDRLEKRLALENSLIKGMPAPLFDAVSIAGKKMTLKDFRGRYVVIDVWATWCAPCKQESPFFERYAEMYAGDKLAFVSLSVDEGNNVFSWQFEAAAKSKRVVQLRVDDAFGFMNKYGIEMIPRFILIDPQGNIAMMNMPRASDKLFEDYLRREAGIAL
ncbi:MAG TPA: ABC transporter permease [Chitinophagaceae bacterium]|nr:ABC transporter permease [Chitinophagaceae bacterium]